MWVWLPEGRDSLIATLRRSTLLETDDSGSQQMLKRMRGLASEQFSDVYRAQPHGFSSHAPSGSEGLYLALGGRSDRLIGLGFEHKDKRPKNLPEGGTAIYDADGKLLKIVKDNTDWDCGGKPITIHNSSDVVIGTGKRFIRVRDNRVDLAIKSPTEN